MKLSTFVVVAVALLLWQTNAAAQTTSASGLSLKELLTTLTGPIVQDPNANQLGALLAGEAGLEVSTAPLASSSGGFTFTFDPSLGIVGRRVQSFGPSFSERAFTLGARKASVGMNFTWTHYDQLQGHDIRDGSLVVRRSLNAAGNEVVRYNLGLDMKTKTLTVFGSYGVTNNLDIAFAVPYVSVTLNGQVLVSSPVRLLQSLVAAGDASGVGDIALRAKYKLKDAPHGAFAVGLDARLPTGDQENLLGIGTSRTLVSALGSVQVGSAWVHGNAGYEFWAQGLNIPDITTGGAFSAKNQIVYAASTDVPLHPKLTLSGELSGRMLRDGGRLAFSTFTFGPNVTGVRSAEALVATPGSLRRVAAIVGVKWNAFGTALISANVMTPLVHDGLTARITPVIGFDWSF